MGKRFNVATPRPKHDGGTFWLRVGSAWQNEKGLITVYLDSYPIPDREGAVKMMLFEPEPNKDPIRTPAREPQEPRRPWNEELDDEIPF